MADENRDREGMPDVGYPYGTSAHEPHVGEPAGPVGTDATRKAPADDTLRAQVEERLWTDDTLDLKQVKVDVKHGIVTLRGSAPNEQLRSLAGELARNIAGVREVRDELETPSP